MSFFRYDDCVRSTLGQSVAGASVAVLTQPADTSNEPGSPLAVLYAASASNAATISSISFANGFISFTFSATPPVDVVPGSYIRVTGVTPAFYNTVWLVDSVLGDVVNVLYASTPPAYSSGGTVATSALPNPLITDSLGNYFFYANQGTYTIQTYDLLNRIQPLVLADQVVISPGGGTVTSVGFTGDGQIYETSVPGSPVTGSDTFIPNLTTQAANLVFASPSSGPDGTGTWRKLVVADFSSTPGSVTSVDASLTGGTLFTAASSGGPVTSTGVIALTFDLLPQAANTFLAGATSGGSGAITARLIVGADLPAPSPTTFGGILSLASATAHQFVTFVDNTGTQNLSVVNFTDLAGTLTIAQINSKRGNGSFVQLAVSGTAGAAGDVVTFDVNGNTVDSGTLLSSLVTVQANADTTPTTPVTATTILAAAPAGKYRVSFYSVVTTSGVGGTNFVLNFLYTDAHGSQTVAAFTNTTFTAGDVNEGDFVMRTSGTNDIKYTITESGVFSPHPVLALSLTLERLA